MLGLFPWENPGHKNGWWFFALSLWKMMEFVSWDYSSQLNVKIKLMFQTTNQSLSTITNYYHQPSLLTINHWYYWPLSTMVGLFHGWITKGTPLTFRKSPLDDLSQIFEVQSSATLRTGHTLSLSNLRSARKSWTLLRQVTGQKKNMPFCCSRKWWFHHGLTCKRNMKNVGIAWLESNTNWQNLRKNIDAQSRKLSRKHAKMVTNLGLNPPLDITVGG